MRFPPAILFERLTLPKLYGCSNIIGPAFHGPLDDFRMIFSRTHARGRGGNARCKLARLKATCQPLPYVRARDILRTVHNVCFVNDDDRQARLLQEPILMRGEGHCSCW